MHFAIHSITWQTHSSGCKTTLEVINILLNI